MEEKNKSIEVAEFGRPFIAASFTDKGKDKIESAFENGLDIAEIRVDLFEDKSPKSINSVINCIGKKPKILTIRSSVEGGSWNDTENQRLDIYKKFIPISEAVDIELSSKTIIDEVIDEAKKNNVNVIISYHNFEQTPDIEELKNVISQAREKGADIVKIATHINSEKDIEILKQVLSDSQNDLVIIGMGEKGTKTRVEFPRFGSLITFCNVERETAPGQIGLNELQEMLSNLS